MSEALYTRDVIKSWSELHRDCRLLAQKLLIQGSWKGIIAVTRGGMIPAAIIARELDIRLIDTFCIASYDKQQQGELIVLKDPVVTSEGDGYLIIDDLVDTGNTLAVVRKALPKAHVGTLYVKPAGQPLVDTFVQAFSQETWIRFPWDLALGYAVPLVEEVKDIEC
ncbi:xanthine phosphoribosyltransferase [Kistimonas scapharcae]